MGLDILNQYDVIDDHAYVQQTQQMMQGCKPTALLSPEPEPKLNKILLLLED